MVLANENSADTAAVGALPSPTKNQEPSLEKTQDMTTDDDDDGYTSDTRKDGGTEKTRELISIFHQRNSPLRGGGHPSPIRTESTMGTSSASREEKKLQSKMGKKAHANPPPLLPQRSNDRTNPFVALQPDRSSEARQLSMSTISSDTNGSFHGDTALDTGDRLDKTGSQTPPKSKMTTPSKKTTPTQPTVTRGNRNRGRVSFSPVDQADEEVDSCSDTTKSSDELFLFTDLPCVFSEVLCLKTRLATTKKIISTLEGELKRRKKSTPKKKGTKRGLHFEEHFECLMLSREEDSLSPVPSTEPETETVAREGSLVSEIRNVVEKLPRCETVSLLLELRSRGDSWYIASDRIESSGKRLDFA